MRALGVDGRRDRHPPRRAADAGATWATPSPRASRSTTSPSRTCRRGCGPTICSASPTSGAASSSAPATCRELALGWCTYGVGDQMSHYAVNAGVPKTLIQYLIRWAVAHGPVRRRDRRRARGDPRHRDLARAGARRTPSGAIQSTEDKIGPYELHDFFLFHIMRYGLPPSKVAFLAWHAWRDAEAGLWPIGFPEDAQAPIRPRHDPQVAGELPLALLRLQPVQALGHAERPEGLRRRRAVAARRLAGAVRRHRGALARRAEAERSGGLISG